MVGWTLRTHKVSCPFSDKKTTIYIYRVFFLWVWISKLKGNGQKNCMASRLEATNGKSIHIAYGQLSRNEWQKDFQFIRHKRMGEKVLWMRKNLMVLIETVLPLSLYLWHYPNKFAEYQDSSLHSLQVSTGLSTPYRIRFKEGRSTSLTRLFKRI